MQFPVEEKQDKSLVRLSGDIDLDSTPSARRAIMICLKKGRGVMVDLSKVRYIDSSGVAVLVEGFQYARSRKLEFVLVNVSSRVMSVLSIARLDKVFPILELEEAALEHAG